MESWLYSESFTVTPQNKGRIVQHHGEHLSSCRRSRVGERWEFVAGSPASLIFHSWPATKYPSFSIPVVFNSFLYLTRLLGMNALNLPPIFLPPYYLHPPPIFTTLPFQWGAFLLWSISSCSISSWLFKDHFSSNIFSTQLLSPQPSTVVFHGSKEILQLQSLLWLLFILISSLLSLVERIAGVPFSTLSPISS